MNYYQREKLSNLFVSVAANTVGLGIAIGGSIAATHFFGGDMKQNAMMSVGAYFIFKALTPNRN